MRQKPFVLVAVDAKYTHTNPAVRSIAAFALQRNGENIPIEEFTINNRPDYILSSLYRLDAALYLFSCYIWNIALVRQVARELRKIRPHALLAAGGPEVSSHSRDFLRDNPCFDLVLPGEGEETAAELFSLLRTGGDLTGCPGLVLRTKRGIIATPPRQPPHMDDLPFPYQDLEALAGRVIYYETMRGCPFSCAYCLSAAGRGVRLRSLELVFRDFRRLLEARVPKVKLVDRTFNCNKRHAIEIWRFLMAEDNGITNFHFELAGELLDEDMLALLARARPGLFQFEIGVQSCNGDTLKAIDRPANLDKLFATVERLREPNNIHLHLDLIAGLPLEDYHSFTRSFNRVYAARPSQLQLGFLKVLKGSPMEERAEEYGLVCRSDAPYQVLETRWISYPELEALGEVEEMVELYHNSGRFFHLVRHLEQFFPTPFDLYQAMAKSYRELGFHRRPPSKTDYYRLPAHLMDREGIPVTPVEQWLCRYDMLLHEKIRTLPSWVEAEGITPWREQIRLFYREPALVARFLPGYEEFGPQQLERMTHLEVFPFHPATGDAGPVAILFDYRRRTVEGRALDTPVSDCFFAL